MGRNNQRESWAYSGIAVSDHEWACRVISDCAVDSGRCFQAGAPGLACAVQRGFSLPGAVDGQACLAKYGVKLQDVAQIHRQCVNLRRLLPTSETLLGLSTLTFWHLKKKEIPNY